MVPPMALFSSSSLSNTSAIILGVIRAFFSLFAMFPAIYTTYAVKYSSTAAINTADPLPIRYRGSLVFKCRRIRPTGNTNPARLDIVLELPTEDTFDLLPDFPALPALPAFGGIDGEIALDAVDFLGTLLSRAGGRGIGREEAEKREPVGNPENNEVEWTGGEVSNRVAGTLDVVLAIDVALKASFPPLSRPSRTVNEGNIENTFTLYPASL